jgi:hypothetical protein
MVIASVKLITKLVMKCLYVSLFFLYFLHVEISNKASIVITNLNLKRVLSYV